MLYPIQRAIIHCTSIAMTSGAAKVRRLWHSTMIMRASLVVDSRRFIAAIYKAIAGVTISRINYGKREIVAIIKTRNDESALKKKKKKLE